MVKILLIAGVGAAAMFVTPLARADDAQFISDLNSIGIQGPTNTLEGYGQTICQELAKGVSATSLSNTIMTSSGISRAEADAAVKFANKDLCPTQ